MNTLKTAALLMLAGMVMAGSAHEGRAQFSYKTTIDRSGQQHGVRTEMVLTDSLASYSTGLETGYALSLEYTPLNIEGLLLGVGGEFQLPRKLTGAGGKVRHHSVYAIGRGTFPGRITMYAVGRFGAGLFQPNDAFRKGDNDLDYRMNSTANLRHNLHYGLGGGLFMGENFFMEVMYIRQHTRVEALPYHAGRPLGTSFAFDMTYTRLSFSIGYYIRKKKREEETSYSYY